MTDNDQMQVDAGAAGPALVSPGAAPSVTVDLHPLVLINMSDHITKFRVQTKTAFPVVYGALLGTQEGRHVEVITSCELVFKAEDDGGVKIDMQYLDKRLEAVKQVMAGLELVGWYTTGAAPTAMHMQVHRQFMQKNDSPLFLQLDLAARDDRQAIAMPRVYESITEEAEGQARLVFVQVPYKVETEETEHIAISHIAKAATRDGDGGGSQGRSQLSTQLVNQYNAAQMLHERTRVILDYLRAVDNGALARDHVILRDITSLCNRLPLISHDDFRKEFMTEYNDVLLSVLLASMTSGCEKIDELTNKVNLVYGDKRVARHTPFF